MYNQYKITDSHCHIFPDKIAQKATDSIDIFLRYKSNRHY